MLNEIIITIYYTNCWMVDCPAAVAIQQTVSYSKAHTMCGVTKPKRKGQP